MKALSALSGGGTRRRDLVYWATAAALLHYLRFCPTSESFGDCPAMRRLPTSRVILSCPIPIPMLFWPSRTCIPHTSGWRYFVLRIANTVLPLVAPEIQFAAPCAVTDKSLTLFRTVPGILIDDPTSEWIHPLDFALNK